MTGLVLVLLAATAAAFAVAERLKLERSPVTAPRFDRLLSPTCGCPTSTATLQLTLRRPDRVDASIVDFDGDHVRSLATDSERRRGGTTFAWDGRDDAGEPVRDGRYRLRVHLDRADRTITVPTPIRVDGTPPAVELLSTRPAKLSPDGDGRGDRILFVYRASEIAYAVVAVRGIDAVRGRYYPPGRGRVSWRGRLRGKFVPPGRYRAWLVAVDRAGNRSRPSPAVTIPVRFVELDRERYRARPGSILRVRVDADALTIRRWLQGRGKGKPFLFGRARPGLVAIRLPRSLQPGRYVLGVSAQRHADYALVQIERRGPLSTPRGS